ncbi:MAG: hypothetical protein P1V21_07780 [Rhizobiaceae bacterium]|nr:hypothetical protein [Rhizobiaceae bacterium]
MSITLVDDDHLPDGHVFHRVGNSASTEAGLVDTFASDGGSTRIVGACQVSPGASAMVGARAPFRNSR